ncbi:hypothetical protein Alches_18550 [Alicyclobacillus hesperidum subsp. aegles]|uniref:transposase n=1 Tax=Alicyclobacillus hesperidum TaxID=89784 RepID=UPI0002F46BB9|nr:hypothetical protein Alches_18550 [Alicyclobacillus hesperidum subsp. aegles]
MRAFLAAPLEGIAAFTQLHRRLESDLRFRYQCGFSLHEPAPSVSTLSRVFKAIVDKGVAATLIEEDFGLLFYYSVSMFFGCQETLYKCSVRMHKPFCKPRD